MSDGTIIIDATGSKVRLTLMVSAGLSLEQRQALIAALQAEGFQLEEGTHDG